MSNNYEPGFKSVTSVGKRETLSAIEDNIKDFLDWSFVNIGGFINVQIPTSGISGASHHKLSLVTNDQTFTGNKVWEAKRKEWVYETGITFNGSQPIEISGVYLNNTFLVGPTGSGGYTYTLNYQDGRVLFDNPVNKNSDVEIEYSYRYVQTYKSSVDNGLEINPDVLAAHRIDMPAVLIEMTDRTIQQPYQIGDAENKIFQDVLLHVVCENPVERNNIANALLVQKDKMLHLYDINKVVQSGVYPLSRNGNINPDRLNYDKIVENREYLDKKAYIQNSAITEFNTVANSIYHNIVRWTIEIFP